MPLKDAPIQRKLMVTVLLTSLVALLLMRAVFFVYEFQTFREALIRQLATVGEVIAANSTAALAFENHEDAREILSALKAEQHVVAAGLYDRNGKLFSTYPADILDSDLPASPADRDYAFKRWTLSGFEPVVQGDNRLGTLYLELDAGSMMHDWIRDALGLAVVVIIISLLVAYLISNSLQRQISHPILALADTARAISERRDYSGARHEGGRG